MAVLLSPVGGVAGQFFDNNGNPLTGGKMYSYVAGTTTPQTTYTSSAGTVAHSNPIILDAGGRVPGGEIWLTDGLQYKFVLKNANDVLIGTYDNITGINSNFVNFLTETEVQTATAGQTVFTLATMQYQPGTNNLTVYVDGVNQYDGSAYAYVETSPTVITFTAGLHVGALVKFTTAQSLSSSVTDASLVTYDPPFTNSVVTNVRDKLAQTVSVADFGAVGDGITDDSAIFTNLESGTKGQAIDLLNGIYLVASVPVGNNYYNGAFKVGTDIFWQNRNPRSHPFEGPATSVRHINPRTGTYCGLNVGLFPKTTGGMVMVWREANTHAVQNGTRLKAAWTDDGGRTIQAFPEPDTDQSLPTISYSATADTRNFASGIVNGRFIIVTTRREEPQTSSIYQDPLSIYSTDEGLTWSSAAITGLADKAINFHSKVYTWPAGGTNGAIVFDYRTGGIGALTTANGGVSWTDIGIVVPVNGTFASLSEMSVAQIGSESKWVMVIRTSSLGDFAVSTSANLTTWTTAVDSGVLLKGNPPELMYADGKLFMVSFSRRNQSILTGYENALLIAQGDADLVYLSGGVSGWSGWKVVSQLGFWPTGYISTASVRGRYYALMTASEETAGSSTGRTAFLAMLSTDLVDVADSRTILEAVPQHNLISNGLMDYWPNGTSLTTAATRTLVLPDFTFARSSFDSGFTVSQVAGDTQKYAMRIRRDNGNALTTSMNLTHTLTQLDSSKFIIENEYLGIQFRCLKGAGFSAASGFLTVQVRYTDTAGEQQVTSASGTFATTDEPVQSSATGITPTVNWENYFLQIGPVPTVATQLLIRWTWTPVGTAANDYIDLQQVTLFVGKQRSPVVKRTYAENVNDALPFFWTGTVRSENGSRWISFPTVMHRTPTVTVSAGTASNISTLGFELSHSSAADITVKAQAWL